jgi:hypothetical protein
MVVGGRHDAQAPVAKQKARSARRWGKGRDQPPAKALATIVAIRNQLAAKVSRTRFI